MEFRDILSLSYRTIKSNKLRTGITVSIIALGIFALILIITSIEAASQSLTNSFSTMGANSFSLRFKERTIRFGGNRDRDTKKISKSASRKEKSSNTGRLITYDEATAFKQTYAFPASVSIIIPGPNNAEVKNSRKKTNPDIRVVGTDENYLLINGYKLAYGRNISPTETETGRSVCLLGSTVADKLYPGYPQKALDQVIKVNEDSYRVIGVLEDKGSSAFVNSDKIVITSANNIRRLYSTQNQSFVIAVMVNDLKLMDGAIGEAEGAFRPIRKLSVTDENNFYVDKSDSIAKTLLTNLGFLKYATIAIAFITLIGAAIGLMNIMLVAVNERTREVGLIKALGGKSRDIRLQFLYESVLISLIGAVVGIAAGLLFGNLLGIFLKSGFVFPAGWVIAAIFMCSAVGILAGLYPAQKAARLNPIEALRHE
jgi:putative ABC transport system permease protein